MDDPKAALPAIAAMLGAGPEFAIEHYDLAVAAFKEGLWPLAITEMQKAATGLRQQESPPLNELASGYYVLAKAYLFQGQEAEAAQAYRDGIEAYEALWAQQQRIPPTEDEIPADSALAQLCSELARLYAAQESDSAKWTEALAYGQKAIGYDPENAELYGLVGMMHSLVRQYREAVIMFQEAIRLDPSAREEYAGLMLHAQSMQTHTDRASSDA
jgi:tetratricopeptide (TPR) repeat protein